VGDGREDGLRSQRACGTPCCWGRSERTDQEQKNERVCGAMLQQLRSRGWSGVAPREGEGKQQAFALFCRAFECSCEVFEDDPPHEGDLESTAARRVRASGVGIGTTKGATAAR
jgi:hypothetical protein